MFLFHTVRGQSILGMLQLDPDFASVQGNEKTHVASGNCGETAKVFC